VQGDPRSRANKPSSKVQKQAKKERLRQKRKRIAAAAAAAGNTADAETLRERNLQYYVQTAKADANVQKLMREVGSRLSPCLIPLHEDRPLPMLHRPSSSRRGRYATRCWSCPCLCRPSCTGIAVRVIAEICHTPHLPVLVLAFLTPVKVVRSSMVAHAATVFRVISFKLHGSV